MKTKIKFLATMLIGILLSVNVWGADVTHTWTLPFSSTTNEWRAANNSTSAQFGACNSNGNLNGGKWTNISNGSYLNLPSGGYFLVKVPITSSTTSFTLNASIFAWASNKYAAKNVTITYYTSKNTTEAAICNGATTTSGCYNVSQEITLPNSYVVTSNGTLFIKIAVASGNDGFESLSVSTAEQTCTHSITITKGSTSLGTFELSQTGSVCIDEGSATVSVTNIAPESHYVFDHITATNGSVDNEAKTVSNISANTEIAVVFREAEQVTVTWDDRGNTTNVQVWPGEPLELPMDPTDMPTCAQYFVGWSTQTLTGGGHSAPSDLFKTAISAPETNTTYHAVFAQGEGTADEEKTLDLNFDGGGTTLTVTSASNVPNENVTINGVTLNLAYIDGTNGVTRFQSVKDDDKNPYIELRLCSGTAKGTVTITSTGLSSFKSIEVYAAQKETTNATGTISVGSTLKYTHSLTSATSTSSGEINLGTDAQNIKIECTAGQYRIQRMIIKGIIDGGGIEYSNYVTSCAVYTVTFKSNGADVTSVSNVAPGQQVTAPTLAEIKTQAGIRNACTNYLVGWSTDSHYTNPSAAPSDILKPNAEGKITIPSNITSDVTYYAVYADVVQQ